MLQEKNLSLHFKTKPLNFTEEKCHEVDYFTLLFLKHHLCCKICLSFKPEEIHSKKA